MNDTVIAVEDLGFDYGGSTVLDGVTLRVGAGEILGLVGADGAGKTTLLQIAAGQLPPRRGGVRVLGRDPRAAGVREAVAYMPQGFGLYPDLSVGENLAFFADLHGLPRAQAAGVTAALLARTGLQGFEGRRAGNLSGGMMQKLALSCALVSRPRAMFLDEPTTGVDPVSRRAFWALLDGVRADGVAILYATANMDEAERCDRVAYLEGGRVTRYGTPEALSRVEDAQLIGVAGPAVRRYREPLGRRPGVSLVFPVGVRLHVWLQGGAAPEAFIAGLAQLAPGLSGQLIQPTLGDAMLHFLSQRTAAAP